MTDQPSAPVIEAPTAANGGVPSLAVATTNTIWAKGIPRTNTVFMIISLVLVFGLDLLIVISSPSLFPLWYVMLGILAVFALFYYLENFVFHKKFADSTSPLDKWISVIIVARNLIFLLNFVPVIQLLGIALLGGFIAIFAPIFGGGGSGVGFGAFGLIVPALVVFYIILVASRFAATIPKP